MSAYRHVRVPTEGETIDVAADGTWRVSDRPIIPFIEGDGTGPDIWRASVRVFDAAVEKAYGGKRKILWKEVLAGQKAFDRTKNWLPDETVEAFQQYLVGIKGPLTTPVGGGIRSLNVALRQMLDLYVCLRPVRYFTGDGTPWNQRTGRRHTYRSRICRRATFRLRNPPPIGVVSGPLMPMR